LRGPAGASSPPATQASNTLRPATLPDRRGRTEGRSSRADSCDRLAPNGLKRQRLQNVTPAHGLEQCHFRGGCVFRSHSSADQRQRGKTQAARSEAKKAFWRSTLLNWVQISSQQRSLRCPK
jgi:hypothetical protein